MFESVEMWTIFVIGVLSVCKYLDVFGTVCNTVVVKSKKLKSLSSLVKTRYDNVFMIFWVCTTLIAKSIYLTICQKLNQSVIRVDKNTYEVSYTINGILYTFRVTPKRGPKKLIQALDENDDDITDEIQRYLGPHENFHGDTITPAFFNRSEIILSLSSGDELTFAVDEPLTVNTK